MLVQLVIAAACVIKPRIERLSSNEDLQHKLLHMHMHTNVLL